ncbi:hypothetical protein AX17_003343 [Amanita inopinata Kibby_2008]|nr:hypothetical protein AX17_003343 [Amanita inopinata Kibby_2008]
MESYTRLHGKRPIQQVEWQKGDALDPQTFAHLFPGVDGVVHTLGTLLEVGEEGPGYKASVRGGDPVGLIANYLTTALCDGAGRNPVGKSRGSYEAVNRDAAMRVCEAFIASTPVTAATTEERPRSFVYISAEDIFRPLIPARYIRTKREAERGLTEMIRERKDIRGIYIRPSLVYHPHLRPLTTPAAVLFDLSATLHERIPHSFPTPSSIIRTLGSTLASRLTTSSSGRGMDDVLQTSPLESVANALVTPPIHVDSVAQAICVALNPASGVRGVVTVRRMRELIGWSDSADGEGETRVGRQMEHMGKEV